MSTARRASPFAGRMLIGAGILLLALNLRLAVNAIGPLLPEIRQNLHLSASVAGLLVAAPTLTFAGVGFIAPALARRWGLHRTVVPALGMMAVGQLVRVSAPNAALLFLGSLVGLSGIAVANVLMPSLVRAHFPERIAGMTAAYTTLLSIGGAVASGVSVPFEHAVGGTWQAGLGLWAVFAVLGALWWLPLSRRHDEPGAVGGGVHLRLQDIGRTRLGWLMAGFFGCQSLLAYVIFGWLPEVLTDAGSSDVRAGVLVSVMGMVSVLASACVPIMIGRMPLVAVVFMLTAAFLLGFGGLIVAAGTGWVWLLVVLIGLGTATFPVVLTLLGLRARSAAGTAALSAFAQSTGYLLAAVGPVLFGVLHDLTGRWTASLASLCIVLVIMALTGRKVARPRYIEDELLARETSEA